MLKRQQRWFTTATALVAAVACVGCGGQAEDEPGVGGTGGNAGTGGSAGSGGVAGNAGTGGVASACELPQDPGPCNAAFLRWWFNAETRRCEQFVYGGCAGNANQFETIEACVAGCAPQSAQDPCEAVTCAPPELCVYFSDAAACAMPCGKDSECSIGQGCGCGSSCKGCDDCMSVCKPD